MASKHSRLRLTLFGRTFLLVVAELVANAVCWISAVILFSRHAGTRPSLTLALLAWTLGLRHGIRQEDLIRYFRSAIDNATRRLIGLGQLPVTCGLFFSLGHSTIVISVTVAIAVSSDVFQRMHRIGDIGGIVGSAVSGTFLFLVGTANTIILWRILRQRHRDKIAQKAGEPATAPQDPHHNHMLMLRILGPIVSFVDCPWKMYPVGVLFGFGFDTASSIALLSISALAKKGADGRSIPSSQIIIFPLLFTAGMTLLDSADSILMLYSYAGFPEGSWAIFERRTDVPQHSGLQESIGTMENRHALDVTNMSPDPLSKDGREVKPIEEVKTDDLNQVERDTRVKMNVMSMLSILLTLMSIVVAYTISIIVIMGLIGDQCRPCRAAAEADDGGGFAGRWWRAWARANDNSGYIGAGIVGVFVFTVGGWYGFRAVSKSRKG